jgi:hypothetical protein
MLRVGPEITARLSPAAARSPSRVRHSKTVGIHRVADLRSQLEAADDDRLARLDPCSPGQVRGNRQLGRQVSDPDIFGQRTLDQWQPGGPRW